ncbi:MAG: hypothetical protein ACOX6A_03960 [Atribacter sp.]|uniref:hypothetical protein n=1 Tax=Atribacter sp. TaxID=2847780 RepID=UPI003D9733EB
MSTPIKAFLTAMRSALFLSVFNLVWEILQFKGLAWYAAEPGRFQWEQAMVDQLGILVAIMIVTIPIMVFSRYRRLKV